MQKTSSGCQKYQCGGKSDLIDVAITNQQASDNNLSTLRVFVSERMYVLHTTKRSPQFISRTTIQTPSLTFLILSKQNRTRIGEAI